MEVALEAIGAFAAEDTPRQPGQVWLRVAAHPARHVGPAAPRVQTRHAGGRGQATIAAGAIHITGNRSRFVHFSLPYFDTAYRLVVKRPVLAWPARPSCVLGRVGGSS